MIQNLILLQGNWLSENPPARYAFVSVLITRGMTNRVIPAVQMIYLFTAPGVPFMHFTHLPGGCVCFEWILRDGYSYPELNSFDSKHLPALTQPPNRNKTTCNPHIHPLQQGTAIWMLMSCIKDINNFECYKNNRTKEKRYFERVLYKYGSYSVILSPGVAAHRAAEEPDLTLISSPELAEPPDRKIVLTLGALDLDGGHSTIFFLLVIHNHDLLLLAL
jgi:hypothetical protein